MPKPQEFTGKIVSKEPRKVYKKNEFYGNTNYKLKVLRENGKRENYEIIFAYANLVSQQVFSTIEQSQYIDKRYLFYYERKRNGLILQNWRELENLEKSHAQEN